MRISKIMTGHANMQIGQSKKNVEKDFLKIFTMVTTSTHKFLGNILSSFLSNVYSLSVKHEIETRN